jgi:hypothetical protein
LRRGALALLALTSFVPSLAAQSPATGRLVGTVSGKSPAPAATGAAVEATRVDPEPVLSFRTTVDANGRYRFDSLPPGAYELHVTTPRLDALGLYVPDRRITVDANRDARVDFALPSGAALRDAMCPGLALGKGQGVVVGHARNADTEHPLIGATVVVSWTELAVDRATLKPTGEERIATVATDDRGEYRLCGVPTGSSLSLQLQHGDDASAEVKLAVSEDDGVVTRDLSLIADAVVSGNAILVGTVRGAGGQPLANAELRVVGARSSAVSDATGRYSLAALPPGTRMLTVRRIGYEVLETPVELRAAQTVQRDVQLMRVVSLDSMRVVALRSQLPQFEFDRRSNPFGIYLGPEEIERRGKVSQTADMLVGLPGVTVRGHGSNAQVTSIHGRNGSGACAGMRILQDGLVHLGSVNDVSPSMIAAIEIFTQGAFAPTQYSVRGSCGVMVIWTHAARRRPAPPAGTSEAKGGQAPSRP